MEGGVYTDNWKPRSLTPLSAQPRPMPALFWKWLVSRSITTNEQIDAFLSPRLATMIHPMSLRGMDAAIKRLVSAYENQELICVYGDYDLDGSSGIALLVSGLRGLGFKNVSFYQPSRFLEGYGIHSDALEIIAKRGDKVVISVDCGITAVEEAVRARELGLDLIITDHHLARKAPATAQNKTRNAAAISTGDALADGIVGGKAIVGGDALVEIIPDCLAVINPNQKECEAQLGHLCGVGVGFYVLLALKSALKNTDFDLKSCLDFFTIGTITDMVPLKGENRVLVKHGLKILSKTPRPGLQALMKRLELWGRDLDSQDIGFTLAPKLNALARLELGLRPLDIFLCENLQEAEVLAEQVIATNDKRKKLQNELEEKIMAQIEPELTEPVIVLSAEGHAGVVGLVATKVTQTTGKPAFIVAIHNGEAVGSARGQEQDGLPDALASAALHLERFGGHAQAAGFSLAVDQFENLKKALISYYENKRRSEVSNGESGSGGFSATERTYDVEARVSDFTESFMTWLQHAGPFGSENPLPRFKITDPLITAVRWLKGQHLKITLSENGRTLDALAFFAHGQFDVLPGQKVQLLVEPGWNYFRGQKTIQLIIRDLRPTAP